MKTCALSLVLLVCSFASAQNAQTDAVKRDTAKIAADSWLSLLDARDYFENWDQANLVFKTGINKGAWEIIWKSVRDPLGDFQARSFKKSDFKIHLPEDPKEDKWVVVEYDSIFARRSATEIVALKQDKDGIWRVAGYNVVPTGPGRTLLAQSPAPSTPAAATQTSQPPQN